MRDSSKSAISRQAFNQGALAPGALFFRLQLARQAGRFLACKVALVGIFEARVIDESGLSLALTGHYQPGLGATSPIEPALNESGLPDEPEGLGLGDSERFEGDLLPYSDCGGMSWDGGMIHGGCLPARVRLCGATASDPFANPGTVFFRARDSNPEHTTTGQPRPLSGGDPTSEERHSTPVETSPGIVLPRRRRRPAFWNKSIWEIPAGFAVVKGGNRDRPGLTRLLAKPVMADARRAHFRPLPTSNRQKAAHNWRLNFDHFLWIRVSPPEKMNFPR